MTDDRLLPVLAVVLALLTSASAACLLRISQKADRTRARLLVAQGDASQRISRRDRDGTTGDAPRRLSVLRVPLQLISALGRTILHSGLMSTATLEALGHTLTASGMRSANALPLFVGTKLLLALAMPGLGYLTAHSAGSGTMFTYLGPAIAGCLGLVLPDYIIRKIRTGYVTKVEAGVPDALDMMVICARAGLSLEPAISRVAQEILHARPEMAREMAQTAAEMHVMADARLALTALGVRTGLESLKRLTSTLIQTMEYGTPLVDALRTLSAELRTAVLTRAEERAARLPVMLTIPMILFILPCQFIVAAGPAALQISRAFSN